MIDTPAENLSLKQLFSNDAYKIPVYQRNYDWDELQIMQLINDIYDYAKAKANAKVNQSSDDSAKSNQSNYYLGSLVVHQKNGYFEVLDGQQRLTTLILLVCYLKYRSIPNADAEFKDWDVKPNLSFESRPKSDETIHTLFKVFCDKSNSTPTSDKIAEDFLELLASINIGDCSASIINGFKIIEKVIREDICKKDVNALNSFTSYLTSNVKILRVCVPKNTDVTHYFEVMNNRGEQLEKHEVVKANLLSAVQVDSEAMAIIHKVWLACADMSRYVQMGFSADERRAIFSDDGQNFLVDGFENESGVDTFNGLRCVFKGASSDIILEDRLSLSKSLERGKEKLNQEKAKEKVKANNEDEGAKERFNSVIDFSNFLMQVLRIYVKIKTIPNKNFPTLDDKDLINAFNELIGKNGEKAKDFVFLLLKMRYLFDRYIVKRDANIKGEWSLQRYKLDGSNSSYINTFAADKENKQCLMLLSAFHVSYPANSNKNWLAAVLYWLEEQTDLASIDQHYLSFLENLARNFLVRRYLSDPQQGYASFIYHDKTEPLPELSKDKALLINLKYGKVASFVFNYLDYLLWREQRSSIKNGENFKFSFKSSVEHFSPQTPKANQTLKEDDLHSFGNLCLMANTDNSSLGNSSPREKTGVLEGKRNSMAPLSLKLELMMQQATGEKPGWDSVAINTHGNKMLDVIKKELGLEHG